MIDWSTLTIPQLLKMPMSPVVLRRIFLLLTREHYADPAHFGLYQELLQGVQYTDDPKSSSISIDLMHTYDPEKAMSDPSIFIGFQPFNLKKVVVNNYSGQNDDESVTEYNMSCDAVLLLRHVSAQADMALLLGELSLEMIYGLRPLIMERLCLRALDPGTLSDPRLTAKAPNRMMYVDLACPLNFSYQINVNEESHRLKKVAFQFSY